MYIETTFQNIRLRNLREKPGRKSSLSPSTNQTFFEQNEQTHS